MKEFSMKFFGRTQLFNNKGQAMVETALVLMLLVMLIFGMTEFGRAMYTKNMLNNAARAAARAAVVTPGLPAPGTNPTYPVRTFTTGQDCSTITTDNVQQTICKSLYYVNRPDISATVLVAHAGSNTGPTAQTNDLVTVTVTNNNFTSMVPRLIGPTGLVPLSNILTGTATMRYE